MSSESISFEYVVFDVITDGFYSLLNITLICNFMRMADLSEIHNKTMAEVI